MTKFSFLPAGIIIALFILIASCEKQEIPPPLEASKLVLEPDITAYSGIPGGVINLKIKIEGEEGFNSVQLRKSEGERLIEEELLLPKKEGKYEAPHELEFEYVIKNSDPDKFTLTFLVETVNQLSSGGILTSTNQKTLEVTVD